MENSLVIYRKYRPQTFAEVVGQEHITKTITYAISQGRPAHAYLFSGTRGVGKTTIARLIAKALNCQRRSKYLGTAKKPPRADFLYEPCNKCDNCQAVEKNAAVDIIELDAASHRGIDEAKSLIESVKYPPVEFPYKIFIIDEVHMLTREAFNALLKTIEEPPAYVVFILATTEPDKVPQTIISRCQYFEFKRLTPAQIRKKVDLILKKEGIQMDSRSLDFIAQSGQGSLRDTESIIEQIISQSHKKISWEDLENLLGIINPELLQNFLRALIGQQPKKAINLVNDIFKRGKDMSQFSRQIVDMVRKIILGKIDKELLGVHNLSANEIKNILDLGQNLSENQLLKWVDIFSRAQRDINKYPLGQMAMEVAALEAIEALK